MGRDAPWHSLAAPGIRQTSAAPPGGSSGVSGKQRGSPLKLVPVWFLLINLPDPRMENKLCWMPCTCRFPPCILGVTSVRSQGDEQRRRGVPSLQQWLFL